jgi:hypothetical protein
MGMGRSHTSVLFEESKIATWGSNELGQTGSGTKDEVPHVSPIPAFFPAPEEGMCFSTFVPENRSKRLM